MHEILISMKENKDVQSKIKGLTHLCRGDFTKHHYWLDRMILHCLSPFLLMSTDVNCVAFDIIL